MRGVHQAVLTDFARVGDGHAFVRHRHSGHVESTFDWCTEINVYRIGRYT